jgi:hypothetical protein
MNFRLMSLQAFRLFSPSIIIFVLLSIGSWIFRNEIQASGIDPLILMTGNGLIFFVTLVAYLMETRGLDSSSNAAFLRMFYGSFILKLIILIAAAFIYIASTKKNVNKPALFSCMALYIVYTFIEVRALMKIGKVKKHV